jgi:hypothetical protein
LSTIIRFELTIVLARLAPFDVSVYVSFQIPDSVVAPAMSRHSNAAVVCTAHKNAWFVPEDVSVMVAY